MLNRVQGGWQAVLRGSRNLVIHRITVDPTCPQASLVSQGMQRVRSAADFLRLSRTPLKKVYDHIVTTQSQPYS